MKYISLTKRPLFCFTLCVISGIIAGRYAGNVTIGFIALAVSAVAALMLPWRFFMLLPGLALGFTITSLWLSPPPPLTGTYALTGTVIDAQTTDNSILAMLKDVTAFDGAKPITVKRKIRLSLRGTKDEINAAIQTIKNGREITLPTATWRAPRPQRNPGGFDEALYLAKTGIFHVASGNLADAEYGPRRVTVYGLTLSLRDALEKSIDAVGENAALLKALLLGYRSELSDDMREAFRFSGLTHLMAVSGLHVNLFVYWIALLLEKLRVHIKVRFVAITVALAIYCAVTGFTASAIRAAVMSVVMLLSKLVYRKNDPLTTLSAAALILCVSPLSLFGVGFQISFCAMLGIYTVTARMERFWRKWRIAPLRYIMSGLFLSLGAMAGTVPIATYYFNYVSLVSLPLQLIVIPLVEIIMPLGWLYSIVYSFPIAQALPELGAPIRFLLSALSGLASYAGRLPWSGVNVASPPIYAVAAYYLILMLSGGYIFSEGILMRRSAALTAAITAAVAVTGFATRFRGLEITVIDVGQGDGTVITTPAGRNYVIDTGPYTQVAQYLLHTGKRVEGLFLSHLHSDHAGGLEYLLENIPVNQIYIPENALISADEAVLAAMRKAQAASMRITILKAGDKLALDAETTLSVLYPSAGTTFFSQNETSLVLRVEYKGTAMLFTGDIETFAELALTSSGMDLTADILKLAHHGSNTSSSAYFLKLVGPKIAVSSAGAGNSYGHPSPDVLSRLAEYDIMLFRTDLSGSITLRITEGRISAQPFID